jgi:hypothetical protein
MARTVGSAVAVALLVAACSGGGSHGSGLSEGSVDWGIPFVPDSLGRSMLVSFHNLDFHSTTATYQRYLADGSLLGGLVAVDLDGDDEHVVAIPGTSGGWIRVATPSRQVEVGFSVSDTSKGADEASRAWPLGDLAAPPASIVATVTVTTETTRLQLVNATGIATVVTPTAYAEPLNPLDPPVASTPAPIVLAPFESITFPPSLLLGVGQVGAIRFDAATPIFCAAEEDLAFDGVPPLVRAGRTVQADVRFGLDHAAPARYTDFVLVVRNDATVARAVVVNSVYRADGTAILLTGPRVIALAPHESRTLSTLDYPFDDLFGDATLASYLTTARIELSLPEEVEATFRQFDPVFPGDAMTIVPSPEGHTFDVLQVDPSILLPSDTRTFIVLHNPNAASLSVVVSSLVPQPAGFDAAPIAIETVTIPAHGFVEWTPDGRGAYRDRDGVARAFIALRITCNTSFAVTGRREVRSIATGFLQELSPTVVRCFDDAR